MLVGLYSAEFARKGAVVRYARSADPLSLEQPTFQFRTDTGRFSPEFVARFAYS
jgi:hypothetical protein